MLNVGPIDVPLREFEVRFDRLARVVGIAHDQPADDEHAMGVQMADRIDAGVPHGAAVVAECIFGAGAQKPQIVVQHVFDS